MFDNLRQQMVDTTQSEIDSGGAGAGGMPAILGIFTSLTPQQRFILALMLFLNVSVLGCLALLVMERIALPF